MKKINNKLNLYITIFSKFLIKGLLIIIPVWITWYVVQRLADWVISKSEIFLFYLPQEEINNHKILYRIVAVMTSLFLLFILGYISEKTMFGKKIDKGLDNTLSSIKGIGGIYSFANKLTEIFGKEQQNTGKPVVLPFLNDYFPQVGYITNAASISCYNKGLQKETLHYVVNFGPAFALMGGSVVLVPEEFIEEYEDKWVIKFTTDEAFKFNLSGGSILPDKFLLKKVEEIKENH